MKGTCVKAVEWYRFPAAARYDPYPDVIGNPAEDSNPDDLATWLGFHDPDGLNRHGVVVPHGFETLRSYLEDRFVSSEDLKSHGRERKAEFCVRHINCEMERSPKIVTQFVARYGAASTPPALPGDGWITDGSGRMVGTIVVDSRQHPRVGRFNRTLPLVEVRAQTAGMPLQHLVRLANGDTLLWSAAATEDIAEQAAAGVPLKWAVPATSKSPQA